MEQTILPVAGDGSVTIPAELARTLGLMPGMQTLVQQMDDQLVILSFASHLQRIQQELRTYIPADVDMVAELIAERRAEAQADKDEQAA